MQGHEQNNDEHDLSGVNLATNGVPISIDIGQININSTAGGTVTISSFPERNDAEPAQAEDGNADDDGEDEEVEEKVRFVFAVVAHNGSDDPKAASPHFRVAVGDNGKNWYELQRGPIPQAIRVQFQVYPLRVNGTPPAPGDYYVVVTVVREDTPVVDEPEEPNDEKEPVKSKAKAIAAFKFVN